MADMRRKPESAREGSNYYSVEHPKFVVGLYGIRDGAKVFLGTGWATNGFIVTAMHVVDKDFDHISIRHKDNYFRTAHTDWKIIGPDVAAISNERRWTIPEAKVDALCGSHFVTVYSAHANQNCSMGVLKHTPTVAFGSTAYEGSTRPGFSGAPYYNGHRVMGMHVGGGNTNYGYSASYIMTLLQRVRSKESSELEQVKRALRTARRSDVELYHGLDETEVRVGGCYWVIQNAEIDELYEIEEFEDLLYDYDEPAQGKGKRRRYRKQRYFDDDYEPDYDYEPEAEARVESVTVGTQTEPPPKKVSVDVQVDISPIRITRSAQTDFPKAVVAKTSKASSTTASDAVIASVTTGTSSTQSTSTCPMETTVGQPEQLTKLMSAFESMLRNALSPSNPIAAPVAANMSSVSPMLPLPMPSGSNALPCGMSQTSISGSNASSKPSTPKVQRGSGSSASSPPLAMRWDTMDSDLQRLKEWRSSVNPRSVGYAASREAFLDTLSLSRVQKQALIARLKGWLKKGKMRARAQAQMAGRQSPTPSNSS